MKGMNRIKEIDGADFVAVVEPGVVTGDLQSAARNKGLYYPPDPASLKNCSIGGNIATNAGGPRCLKYGVTRHYVLGLEVALANGAIVRCGGRTHKNKTGFDLVGLFVGSEGLLGRRNGGDFTPPAVSARSCCSLCGLSQHASGSSGRFKPCLLADFFRPLSKWPIVSRSRPPGNSSPERASPWQRASAPRGGRPAEQCARRSQGSGKAPARAARNGNRNGDGRASCERLWDLRRAFSESLKATGLKKLNEDIVVPRGKLVDLVELCPGLQTRSGFPIACFGHAGDGNIHVNIMVGEYEDPQIHARADAALDELFSQIIAWGGAITGEHGIGLAKKPWWNLALSEQNRALHRVLKRRARSQGATQSRKVRLNNSWRRTEDASCFQRSRDEEHSFCKGARRQ
mgnify:CR=1 FL=1